MDLNTSPRASKSPSWRAQELLELSEIPQKIAKSSSLQLGANGVTLVLGLPNQGSLPWSLASPVAPHLPAETHTYIVALICCAAARPHLGGYSPTPLV